MSFNVNLSIPINFNDNHAKNGGQANIAASPQPEGDDLLPPSPNRSPNSDANDDDSLNDEYVAQINNEFQPVYNLNSIRLPHDEMMGGRLWNEYNWHYMNRFNRQPGYFRHDGNRPVQPTPVYPYWPVDRPYSNRPARFGTMGIVGGFGGLGGGFMSGPAEANTSRPRAEPPTDDPPRDREGTNPQPFDQQPRPRMKRYGGLGPRNVGGGDQAENDHPLMSGENPSPSFNPENEPFGGNADCDDRSKSPIPTTKPPSFNLNALLDSLRKELTTAIRNISEKFQPANIVSSPSSDGSRSLVDD
jgi:hypothetical protein